MNTRDLQRFFLRVCTALAMGVAALPVMAQVAPPLGEAGSFAVLGGSAVTNTGSTVIAGNLGVSPGTAVTGFPPGVVVDGTIHVDDAVAQQARTDLTTAYNFLAGQAPDVDLTGVDLGGLVLVPGVYRFAAGAQLTGTLTLDAQGDPNAVFVFQIGSTLTTASAATLGTASSLPGSMLALTSITLTTNASLSGRALARNGAVTLDTNSIVGCVAACEAITLSPPTLPNPGQGTPYNEAISAEGGVAPISSPSRPARCQPALRCPMQAWCPARPVPSVPSNSPSRRPTASNARARTCMRSWYRRPAVRRSRLRRRRCRGRW